MLRVLSAALMCGALLGTSAWAEDEEPEPVEYVRVCDVYGTGFFYIPGTETCLRIGDDLVLSDMRYDLNPRIGFYSPFQRDFLETNGGATNPALTLNVPSAGFELGFNLGAKIEYGKFRPLDGDLNLSVGYQTGSASITDMSFPTGVGAPNTGGGVIGAYEGGPRSLTAEFDFNRTFASLDKRFGIPLGEGELDLGNGFPSIDWRSSAYFGGRGGVLNQNEVFAGETDTGSTVRYDTSIIGGFLGAYAGLGLDKAMDIPGSEFMLLENFHVAAGFNHYSLRTTDTLTATGGLVPNGTQSNTVMTNHLVPTLDFGAGIGLGKKDGMQFNLDFGATTGVNPPIGIKRPTSNVNGPLNVTLLQSIQYSMLFSATVPIR